MKQGENRSYHHGDLRRALLDAASQLVAERGRPDFTLREVARQAGVSHNAPYNHFADKAAWVLDAGFAFLRALFFAPFLLLACLVAKRSRKLK